jgi:polyferredoxin
MATPLVTIAQIRHHGSAPWYRSPKVLRHAVMAFFFLFLMHVAWDHQAQGGGPRGTPSVEAYCPFGGLETLYQFLTSGGFVRRIEPSALILLAAVVLLTLVASRGFCGWICPFGSLQEWIGLLGRKLLKKRFNPTGAWDRSLRYLKYAILAAIIALTWHTGSLVFRAYDPFLAFFHLGRNVAEMPWAYGILGLVLAGSLWIERFFCKYACPLGAFLGILGKLGLTKVQRDPADCKSCNLCQKKCPAHVDFLSTTTIRDAECNHCMDCVVDCPRPNVLSLRGPRWRFSHAGYAALLVAGLALTVGTSQVAGKWRTKPSAVSLTDQQGKPNPEAVRGWMTLQDISAGYGIPIPVLYSAAGLPSNVAPTTPLKDVARTYRLKFDPDRMREVVRRHLEAKPGPEAIPAPPASPVKPVAPQHPGAGQPSGGEEPDVKGFMTLNEIELKTGVPTDYILRTLGLPASVDSRAPVREWMHQQGKSIQDLRQAVEEYRKTKR